MNGDKLHEYIEMLLPERTGVLKKMEAYASENNVPIMEPAGMEAMLQILRIKAPESILEIGTAIGYSALRMAFALPSANIVTVERDALRMEKAKEYIREAERENQVHLVYGDALETAETIREHGPFDVIFIDAAKGQYRRFFETYSVMLKPKGILITDNVLFKGLVAEETQTIEKKRIRSLVGKIDDYNRWLMSHPEFDTVILPVGDGVAVSVLR